MDFDISEFDTSNFLLPSYNMPSILIIGRDINERKDLIKLIMEQFVSKYGIVISKEHCFYETFLPNIKKHAIYNNAYLRDHMNEFIYYNTQNLMLPVERDLRSYVILDDCFDHPEMHHVEGSFYKYLCDHKLFKAYPFICTTSMPINLIPEVKYRFDYVILLHEPEDVMKKQYYYHYADMFRTYEDFNNVMFKLTKINSNMLLDFRCKSSNFTDKVYRIGKNLIPSFNTNS